MRLDQALVARGFAPTRSKAAELICNDCVMVYRNSVALPQVKPSLLVTDDDQLQVIENTILKYVSRGGLKIEAACHHFGVSIQDKVVLDCGQSTGGFTDYCLKNGAKHIIGIEVGSNQLDQSLRGHPKILLFENTNIIEAFDVISRAHPGLNPNFLVADVSFTSLLHVLPGLLKFNPQEMLLLIKPQFELKKSDLNKKGIVKDPVKAKKISESVANKIKTLAGLNLVGLIESTIKGGDGNQEYFAYFKGPQK